MDLLNATYNFCQRLGLVANLLLVAILCPFVGGFIILYI